MGGSQSSSLTDNVVDIAVNAATTVDMSAFANLNARNDISIRGCHNVTIRDVNQKISGMIDFRAYQQAVQSTSQSLNLDQVIKQQQEMIAQSISLTTQQMDTVTHNLTRINQTIQNAASQSCSTNTNLTNNITFEYCSNIDATLLRQENAATVIQNCVMQAVQSSEQYTALKQLLDQKSSMKVENTFATFLYILIAIAVIIVLVIVGIPLFGVATFQATLKAIVSWRMLVILLVIAVIVGTIFLVRYFLRKRESRKKEDKGDDATTKPSMSPSKDPPQNPGATSGTPAGASETHVQPTSPPSANPTSNQVAPPAKSKIE